MTKYRKLLIACIAVLFLTVWLMIMYILEKPQVTVDYFTQYNDLTRPKPFNPKDNAADLLEKLSGPEFNPEDFDFNSFIYSHEFEDFPEKFSPEDLENLKTWLTKNEPRLEAINKIAQKPYYYKAVDSSLYKNELLQDQSCSYDVDYYDIGRLLSWSVLYDLHEGNFNSAIKHMGISLNLCKLLNRQGSFFTQYVTTFHFLEIVDLLYSHLQKQQLSPEALKVIQQMLMQYNPAYQYDTSIAKLHFMDYIQKMHTKGDHGHLAPLAYIREETGGMDFSDAGNVLQCFFTAFNGENRKKTVDRMESIFAKLDAWKEQPLYQLHLQGINPEAELNHLAGENVIVQKQAGQLLILLVEPYQTVCKMHALAAIAAIQRYSCDHSRFPESLEELLNTGYIDHLPQDCYSGKPLVYRKVDSNFILYSLGVDFEDDGGLPSLCKSCGTHLTNWGDGPVYRKGRQNDLSPDNAADIEGDHIFWPVIELPEPSGQTPLQM